jgi:alpha-tubulin suppressor-like RCC1 family protein
MTTNNILFKKNMPTKRIILTLVIFISIGVTVAIQNGCGKLVSGEVGVPSVEEVKKYIQTSGGANNACALLLDGSVKCWGNGYDDTNLAVTTYTDIRSIEFPLNTETNKPLKATSLSASGIIGIVSLEDGSVYTWAASTSPIATKVANVGNMATVSLSEGGCFIRFMQACGVRRDGTAQCWGLNSGLALGTEFKSVSTTSFAYYSDEAISNGLVSQDRYFVMKDGTVNSNKAVAGGGNLALVPLNGLSNVTKISTSNNHACALIEDGQVKCWGINSAGQLGDTTLLSTEYVPVGAFGIENAIDISTSTSVNACSDNTFNGSSCAALDDGSVKCWGSNYGSTPVTVEGLSDIVQLGKADGMAYGSTGLFTASDKLNQVWQWASGQTPIKIEGL